MPVIRCRPRIHVRTIITIIVKTAILIRSFASGPSFFFFVTVVTVFFLLCFARFFFSCRRKVSSAGFPEYQEFQFLSVEFLTPSFLALEFRQAGKYITGIFKIILLPAPPKQPSCGGYDSPAAEAVATCGAKKLNQKRLFLFLFILFPDHSPTQASGVLRITFYRHPYTARALG